jgi:phenylacetate-CoA ligase
MQGTASLCAYERFLNWHRIDPAGMIAMIRAVDAADPDGRMHTGARLLHPESTAVSLAIATPIPDQVSWLLRHQPRYLLSYPSNLAEIARHAAAVGARIDVEAVITAGELTTDDARAAIRGYFGRDPIDVYGATEVGHVAATCPHSGLHHVAAELVLVEVVDEAGNLVADGTPGRLVVTPFYNHAMPLIRYELGDYGFMAATPCGCGRTLPTLAKVLGRARAIFRYVDGSAGWPNVRSWEIADFVRFSQYQLVQLTRTRLELRYVPVEPEGAVDLDGLNAYLRRRLHASVEATVAPMAEIPRSAGGKFEDCMSLVEA